MSQSGGSTSIDEPAGRPIQVPTEGGEQILESGLSTRTSGVAAILPTNMRGFALWGDPALTAVLRTGDSVDLVLVQNEGTQRLTSRTLLQRIPVACVAASCVPGGASIDVRTIVVLAVSLPDFQAILLAQNVGRIHLLIRPQRIGNAVIPVEPVTTDNLAPTLEPMRRPRVQHRAVAYPEPWASAEWGRSDASVTDVSVLTGRNE